MIQSRSPIPSAISAALETNLSLQSELQRLLLKIKCKKVQNRQDATRVMMSFRNEDDHSLRYFPTCTAGDNNSIRPAREENVVSGKRNGGGLALLDIDDTKSSEVAIEFFARKKSKLACNSNRKEMRRFFMDKDGSTPEPMIWGIGREYAIGLPATVIFDRTQPSHFSAVEEVPKKSWKEAKMCAWKDNVFEEISIKIVNTPSRSAEDAVSSLIPIFSFADPKISAVKFTKEECSFIASMINMAGGDKGKTIDWYNFALKYHEKINHQTPWRCFCLFRSSLPNPSTWSPDEDELLLKYLAAHGPQYLLQGDCTVQTCRNLFPDQSTKQVMLRAQSSLMNPNYVQTAWSTNEKRKLALLVRAYSNDPNPINSVSRAVHFPHRATKSVVEKWVNTMNPGMHYQFT